MRDNTPSIVDMGVHRLLLLLLLLLLFLLSSAQLSLSTNHTVGGAASWLFDARTNTSATNYTAWASTQSFHLGDNLIFNTDERSTVIQTFNATTYELCNQRKDFGNLTSQFLPDDGASAAGEITVELQREGLSFFFSDAQGGFQCEKGMRFRIVVGPKPVLPPPPPPPPETRTMPETSGGRRRWRVELSVAIALGVLAVTGW